jgi:hypothetical protein
MAMLPYDFRTQSNLNYLTQPVKLDKTVSLAIMAKAEEIADACQKEQKSLVQDGPEYIPYKKASAKMRKALDEYINARRVVEKFDKTYDLKNVSAVLNGTASIDTLSVATRWSYEEREKAMAKYNKEFNEIGERFNARFDNLRELVKSWRGKTMKTAKLALNVDASKELDTI